VSTNLVFSTQLTMPVLRYDMNPFWLMKNKVALKNLIFSK
jgi:hypothetical protein